MRYITLQNDRLARAEFASIASLVELYSKYYVTVDR